MYARLVRGSTAAALWIVGCRAPAAEHSAPLPAIAVYEITPLDSARVTVARVPAETARDPFAGFGPTRRVTVTASDADARGLLLWLAEQAGISLVISPDVTTRVSVSFENIQAHDAMRAIMAEAGLSVLTAPRQPKWPPVVFFQVPVNMNAASSEELIARFGVSAEMAQFIVESRPK